MEYGLWGLVVGPLWGGQWKGFGSRLAALQVRVCDAFKIPLSRSGITMRPVGVIARSEAGVTLSMKHLDELSHLSLG